MANFDDDLKKELDNQKFADWFYINKLKASNIRRIDYNTEPDKQRQGWDVIITTPKYGEIIIQEKFHPNGSYNSMMVEIADVSGTKDGWATKMVNVDFVIDFSKYKIHIVNAKKLGEVAKSIRTHWIADGGVFHSGDILSCGPHRFYKHKTWTTRFGKQYWSLCAKVPWRDMQKLNIPIKEYNFGLSYPIK